MTSVQTAAPLAVFGGQPAFPDGLVLARPVVPDVPGVLERLEQVLDSGQLTNGRFVREFEDQVAQLCGVDHAVAVSSCTVGLMLVYRSVGVDGPVVIPSMTFAASPHAVVWAGGTPRWADIEAVRLNVDPASVEAQVSGAAAVSATHVYGNPAEVEALEAVAAEHGVPLVFDAAHGLGARRQGRPLGGSGTAEVFSLSPTKIVPAGEGGVVTTNDAALADELRIGRDYANPGDYDCQFVGINGRLSELHAVVALASLSVLPERLARRTALVEGFADSIAGVPGLRVVTAADGDVSTYKDLTVAVDAGSFGLTVPELTAALAAEGVDTRRYFYPPCHQQKAYAALPSAALPVTEAVTPTVLSLPFHTLTTESDLGKLAGLLDRLSSDAVQVRQAITAVPAGGSVT